MVNFRLVSTFSNEVSLYCQSFCFHQKAFYRKDPKSWWRSNFQFSYFSLWHWFRQPCQERSVKAHIFVEKKRISVNLDKDLASDIVDINKPPIGISTKMRSPSDKSQCVWKLFRIRWISISKPVKSAISPQSVPCQSVKAVGKLFHARNCEPNQRLHSR